MENHPQTPHTLDTFDLSTLQYNKANKSTYFAYLFLLALPMCVSLYFCTCEGSRRPILSSFGRSKVYHLRV